MKLSARWSGWTLASPTILFMLAFFVFPSLFLLVYSFWKASSFQITPAFQFDNYVRALTDELFWRVTFNAVIIGLMSAVVCMAMALPVGYYLVFVSRSRLLEQIILVTWFSSYLVRIFAWRTLLGNDGVINTVLQSLGLIDAPIEALLYSRFAVGVTLIHLYLPYCIILVMTAFHEIRQDLIDASRDLGRSQVGAFFSVVVPNASAGLVGAFMLTLIMTMGDFVTPQMLGGTTGQTTGLLIADQFRRTGNWPLGSAQAVIMFLLVVLIFVAVIVAGRTLGFIPKRRKQRAV
ncbi:ABC transporter permease [Fuscibacter oryzae]|uniref:ABC transporter permease n=1 Tax=Fuscibacter oryzae TaxID=2803939 RepID=A0A8J7MTX3_9RHOB|nr:ABC transporter permease [Fuscibacter oryzae]MBL4929531.1 ABC transporter permease [Fuscibacter oryzae]